jgi:hypothetical protein
VATTKLSNLLTPSLQIGISHTVLAVEILSEFTDKHFPYCSCHGNSVGNMNIDMKNEDSLTEVCFDKVCRRHVRDTGILIRMRVLVTEETM